MMKAFSLKGHAALVTGSSQGIGLAIARGLSDAGARVVHHGLEPRSTELPGDVAYLSGDLMKEDAARDLIEGACRAEPGLDILVCNAGSFFDAPFLEMNLDHWEKTVHL